MYEALRACERPWYVASSKAAHRISPLLRSLLGVDMDAASPRLFAGLIPPNERKVAALRCSPGWLVSSPNSNPDCMLPRLFAGLIPSNEREVAALRCAPGCPASNPKPNPG